MEHISEKPIQIITTISEITAIFIRCDCEAHVILKRRSLDASHISGTFCQKCDRQYWIRWNEGVVKREVPTRKEAAK